VQTKGSGLLDGWERELSRSLVLGWRFAEAFGASLTH
jgi:hypothetical protein